MSRVELILGECPEALRALSAESADAVVTDPPYHLTSGKKGGSGPASENLSSPAGRARATTGFMGKAWDGGDVAFRPETWAEVLRVAKPGAYLVAFGGTRTFHRLTSAIEDGGWEIRDCLSWLYGSGFPKSRDIGQGRGTALKPGWEPIVLARKPFLGTVAANVATHTTGALNIDACRIDVDDADYARNCSGDRGHAGTRTEAEDGATNIRAGGGESCALGRWPANVVLDEEAAKLLDEQSGELISGANPRRRGSNKLATTYGDFAGQQHCIPARGLDRGGASRFFYCAKASRGEREAGLEQLPLRAHGVSGGASRAADAGDEYDAAQTIGLNRVVKVRNHHPTVKPISLMRWLVRLVTPPPVQNSIVLDPFAGSGTTGCAAALEGFAFIGIDRDPEYMQIARQRIAYWSSRRELTLFDAEPAA